MTDPIRWGILGAANFAREHMAPAIQLARGARLAALATATPAKADAFRALVPGLHIHDTYEALLADPQIDAVYVPLPNHMHVDWTLKALAAGKPVLTEKPVAMTAAQVDTLIAARDAAGLPATEAYMIVHHPQWQRARALLAEGAVGRLIHVDGFFSFDNADPENIRNRPETGGGSLRDIGVYTMGSVRYATGLEPESLTAEIVWNAGIDGTAHVRARFPGFTFAATTSMRMHPRQEMTFHGADGVLRLTAPFNAGVFGEAQLSLTRGMTTTVERWPRVNQYVLQIEAFGRSLRDGAPLLWTLEDARGTQAMIDAAYGAAG